MTALNLNTLLVMLLILTCISVTHSDPQGQAADEDPGSSTVLGGAPQSKNGLKRLLSQAERLKNIMDIIRESVQFPYDWFEPLEWCRKPNLSSPAIFTSATGNYSGVEAELFARSARKSGFKGDIVVAIRAGVDFEADLIKVFKETDCIVYRVELFCEGKWIDTRCRLKDQVHMLPLAMIRYYMYMWWANLYPQTTSILVADFADTIFQKDPFNYQTKKWAPPKYQLVVFHESFPNKMIYRCPFNRRWIAACYGAEAATRVEQNFVSCSGTTIGSRDAILTYSFVMLEQLDPRVRFGKSLFLPRTGANSKAMNEAKWVDGNRKCNSVGMDQGFHNFLLYSGQLSKFLNIKQFPQGEGPVNTIGAFKGKRALINMTLHQWGVAKGQSPNVIFHNWNGDVSPVVHQWNRFSELFPEEVER